jgi:hypothetical protein
MLMAIPPNSDQCFECSKLGLITPLENAAAQEWMMDADSFDPIVCLPSELAELAGKAPDDTAYGWIMGMTYSRFWLSMVSSCRGIPEFSTGSPLRVAYEKVTARLHQEDGAIMQTLDQQDVLLIERVALETCFASASRPLARGYVGGIIAFRRAVSVVTGVAF